MQTTPTHGNSHTPPSLHHQARSKLPPHVLQVLNALPPDTHPMTQLCAAVLALQPASKFAAAYQSGIHKSKYWEPFYEDTLDLVAKLPEVWY